MCKVKKRENCIFFMELQLKKSYNEPKENVWA